MFEFLRSFFTLCKRLRALESKVSVLEKQNKYLTESLSTIDSQIRIIDGRVLALRDVLYK